MAVGSGLAPWFSCRAPCSAAESSILAWAFHEPAVRSGTGPFVPQTSNRPGQRPLPHSETSEVTENGVVKQLPLRGRSP